MPKLAEQAARDVANACASNPTPLVVLCHRAVRIEGTLGGYRRGSFRKKALFKGEKARELSSVRMPSHRLGGDDNPNLPVKIPH